MLVSNRGIGKLTPIESVNANVEFARAERDPPPGLSDASSILLSMYSMDRQDGKVMNKVHNLTALASISIPMVSLSYYGGEIHSISQNQLQLLIFRGSVFLLIFRNFFSSSRYCFYC